MARFNKKNIIISLAFSENMQIILIGDLNIDFQSDRQ